MYVNRRMRRGQVLVLACVTMLIMALGLMISINMANAIHEKIGIQAAADAQAFSVATLEARAYNTMAYQNRAIAAVLVAEMGLHAWWAIAQHDVNLVKAGFIPFLMIMAEEFGQCASWAFIHCVHAVQALKIAFDYYRTGNSLQNDLDGLKNDFDTAVGDLSDMIKDIHKEQNNFLKSTRWELSSMTSSTLGELKKLNAPKASYKMGIDSLNKQGFECATEGSDLNPSSCDASEKGASERADIMNSAAKAARTDFEIGKYNSLTFVPGDYNNFGTPLPNPISAPGMGSKINPGKPMDIQGEGQFIYATFSRVTTELSSGTGTVSATAPDGVGFVVAIWKDGIGGMVVSKGDITTNRGERNYEGSVCEGDNCFVNYRGDSSADTDFNQPSTYGALSQGLREVREGPSEKPWEVNSTGTVAVELGGGAQLKVQLVARNEGVAVAKGKTYFHQLGQWKQPPNMFDPFWHAKLHPFKRDELGKVLTLAGDAEGAMLARGSGPVEGKE